MAKLIVNKTEVQAQHGLMLLYSFFTLFVVNVLVLLIANALFPSNVVLGNSAVSYWWAVHHSMFKLSVIAVFAMQLVTVYEWKKSVTFTPKQWMLLYFAVNTVTIWGISRFAEQMGLGISAWYVALLLGAALDWVQGMAMMALGKAVKF